MCVLETGVLQTGDMGFCPETSNFGDDSLCSLPENRILNCSSAFIKSSKNLHKRLPGGYAVSIPLFQMVSFYPWTNKHKPSVTWVLELHWSEISSVGAKRSVAMTFLAINLRIIIFYKYTQLLAGLLNCMYQRVNTKLKYILDGLWVVLFSMSFVSRSFSFPFWFLLRWPLKTNQSIRPPALILRESKFIVLNILAWQDILFFLGSGCFQFNLWELKG